jgi:L-rhamnose-H+ transport protein
MQPNPLLGVVFHWLGGLASGSFYVPYKGVRKWSWETFWLAGGMFSWLICPWVGALLLTKDLFAVLHAIPSYTFWMTYLMGVLWGLGGLTFGLTMRYLGMSLGMAVALGYCAAFGTLVPPIVQGQFAQKLLQTHGGNVCFLGVIVCLVGIVIGGFAGVRKEKDMGNDGKSSAIAEFSLMKGLAIATFSGIMSSCFSFGFQFGDPITKISADHGTGPYWVGLPVILVILLGGLTTNFLWCVLLHVKNNSAHQYFSPTVKPVASQTAGGDGHGSKTSVQSFEIGSTVPLVGNWLFCALAGTFWYFQFFFYQMGESQMGNYKFSSWTLHMASIIIFSTLWGIYFKEWKGAKPATRSLVTVMLVFLIGSTVIIGWGNKISSDDDAAKAAAPATTTETQSK